MSERIIEFRAFDTEAKKMSGVFGLKTAYIYTEPKFRVMQFTGLTDKNGVKIFEGDLLKVAGGQIYEIQFIFELQYGEKTCGFGQKSPRLDHAWILDEWAIDNGVVIGNIHENPELLEAK